MTVGGHHVENAPTGQQHAAVVTRADVVREARTWIGTRWQHQASLRGKGSDCLGFLIGVARGLRLSGIEEIENDPQIQGYGLEPKGHLFAPICARYLDPVDVRAIRMGDVLTMRIDGPNPRHFAIVSRRHPDYMIHAYAQARKIVEHGIDATWRTRIIGAWKFREVTDG